MTATQSDGVKQMQKVILFGSESLMKPARQLRLSPLGEFLHATILNHDELSARSFTGESARQPDSTGNDAGRLSGGAAG